MRKPWIVLAAVVWLLVAACSGADPSLDGEVAGDDEPAADDTAADDTAEDEETDEEAPAAEVSCEVDETDGELVLYNWSEYIDPELINEFRDQYGVDVVEDFYPSNEEMLARVQGGASGYDVVVPSDYMVEIMISEDLLLPLDKDAIPNAGNVHPDFTSPPFDPEQTYHMAYQWGTTGLGVSLEDVGEEVEPSWGLIFDPEMSEQFDGRISMLDDPREAMAAALAYLGYSINTTDEAELQEAADLISEARDRLAAFDSDQFEDLLVSGETVVAHGWSGDFFSVFDAQDAWETHAYVIPDEGAVRWVDTMAVLADAPHPCTAHTFLNFILDAENGAQLTNWTFYASPNQAAEEFIDPEIIEDEAIYPPEETIEELEFIEDTGDAEILYNDLFTEAKS